MTLIPPTAAFGDWFDLMPTALKVTYYVWSYGGLVMIGYSLWSGYPLWAVAGIGMTALRWWATGRIL